MFAWCREARLKTQRSVETHRLVEVVDNDPQPVDAVHPQRVCRWVAGPNLGAGRVAPLDEEREAGMPRAFAESRDSPFQSLAVRPSSRSKRAP